MLATAHAGTTNAPDTHTEETRPVRMLVPTERRSDFWLSQTDMLHASNLGVTRNTTDTELAALVDDAAKFDALAAAPAGHLYRLRAALRQPRDIAEAREWGYRIPGGINREEFEENPRKRLGWWWVEDPELTETAAQRRDRLTTDERIVDMKGAARVLSRAYITTKDLKVEADEIRRVLNPHDTTHLESAVRQLSLENPGLDVDTIREQLLAKARKDLLKAFPPRRDRAGQSDLFAIADVARFGRDTTRLDRWYEHATVKQSGRPKGSKTRRRKTS